jgi:hypothetical protein
MDLVSMVFGYFESVTMLGYLMYSDDMYNSSFENYQDKATDNEKKQDESRCYPCCNCKTKHYLHIPKSSVTAIRDSLLKNTKASTADTILLDSFNALDSVNNSF